MQLHATAPFFGPPEAARIGRGVAAALAIVRFARETSLLAYAGPLGLTPDMLDAWVRLGVLRRGLVRFDPLSARDETYLALGTVGARTFSELTGRIVRGFAASAIARGSLKRAHDVEVGDVALALLTLARDDVIEILGIDTDPKTTPVCCSATRNDRGATRAVLRPDAYVVVRGPHGPSALLVEVDRGTTSIARMRAKYAGYLGWLKLNRPELDLGLRAVRVLTIAPSLPRIRALHDAALAENAGRGSSFLLFATREDVLNTAGFPGRLPLVRSLGSTPQSPAPLFTPTKRAD